MLGTLVLLLLCSCSASLQATALSEGTSADHDGAGHRHAGFPVLPAPRTLLGRQPDAGRTASALDELGLIRGGDDFDIQCSSRMAASAGMGEFSPAATQPGRLDNFSYGLYRFDAHDYDRSENFRFRWSSDPQLDQLWIGLGNMASNRWDWLKPDTRELLSLDAQHPMSSYISPTGELLVVVLLSGTQSASLEALRVGDPFVEARFGVNSTPYTFTVIAPVGLSLKSTSYALYATITNYEWDLDGDGDFEVDTDSLAESPVFPVNQPGVRDVSMRISTDWNSTTTLTHELKALDGSWSRQLLTGNINSASHSSSVSNPRLLSSGPNGESPVIVWDQVDVEDPLGSPSYHTTLKVMQATDSSCSSWIAKPEAYSTDSPGVTFTLDGLERLATGEPALIFRISSAPDVLFYQRANSTESESWTEAYALADISGNGGGGILRVDGTLRCAYTQDGSLYYISNIDGAANQWSAPLTIHSGSPSHYNQLAPAMCLGTDDFGFSQVLYFVCQVANTFIPSRQAWTYRSEHDGSLVEDIGYLQSDTPTGDHIAAASYATYPGESRCVLGYADNSGATTVLRWATEDYSDSYGGKLEGYQYLTLGNEGESGELSLASSMPGDHNLGSVLVAYSISGGGLQCYWMGSSIPEPPGGREVEPHDPGDAGSQPSCAWISGHPAIAYVDYASQDIKFAYLD